MIKSRPVRGKVSVTFSLPAAAGAQVVAVCGDWNEWSPTAHVMVPLSGGHELTIELPAGRTYRFKYLVDGHRWENDWSADAYVANDYGSEDSVVDLTAAPAPRTRKAAAPKAPPVTKAAPVRKRVVKKPPEA